MRLNTEKAVGCGLRIQDEVVDSCLMQLRLGALRCCSHPAGHAEAAGIGAARQLGGDTE